MRPVTLSRWLLTTILACLFVQNVVAIEINPDDETSLKNAAKTVATTMMNFYDGRDSKDIPGKMDGTWWEGGSMFMTLIQYWYLTGDSQFNAAIQEGMYWQKGENDFFPSNYSQYLGNDDQVFWGLAAITAGELNFPEKDGEPSWVSLAEGVFNGQVPRWDMNTCGGGLRWQIWPYQNGYGLKNAISNGGLFQLSARLALYTKNATYAEWAEKIWDWSATTPMLRKNWVIADTTSVAADCKDHGDHQWTYNYATYIAGAGYMHNYTNGTESKWLEGISGLIGASEQFFPESGGKQIISDITCEPIDKCDRNQKTFKAYFTSWLGFMSLIVPSNVTADVMGRFKTSAVAACQQCSGGNAGTDCGVRWTKKTEWDGSSGLEQQMSVLGVLNAIMVPFKGQGPYNADNGGTSKSDPHGGTNTKETLGPGPITTGDRVGAGVLTAFFVIIWVGAIFFMLRGH
ncbi:Six-hairpin glycosidase [Penicillium cf. griseofulvum]|uniref:Mannan endo-1,6-alpha-mannosidase n=1 Tax=Penicillium cf. griseofulvum TaxID=2972120 RepID=A0A9W9MSL3_9EURO|nr:Six-hairpin glycosidase [Penicillium cf. griseofulvum]KAJ5446557.1 Six-hairpin glycosidase [Penicillium cf. griseofulvum]KAJ5448296.1 Six-hairpin glycosidase [Penicillium cf. griseofulvum]